jgi:hypothetical protein
VVFGLVGPAERAAPRWDRWTGNRCSRGVVDAGMSLVTVGAAWRCPPRPVVCMPVMSPRADLLGAFGS